MKSAIKYRPEIDGLRALAVLPVVLYHAGAGWLPGGFMGVDVFFVISGYLMTSIIWREMQDGRFSLASFYERRIRRILPALIVVIGATVVLSQIFGLPEHAEATSKSAIAALLSVSNIWFWTQTGYFSPSVEFMPLLHTWSLAVEEQFYLVFPLLLLIAIRSKIDIRVWGLLALPFFWAVGLYLSIAKPAVAFYMLPARFWELLIGAVLGLGIVGSRLGPRTEVGLSWLGIVLLSAAYLLGDSGMLFPGYVALAPCLGAALVIMFVKEGSILGCILASRWAVLIGLVSYSLYLWHWPIIVFFRMAFAKTDLSTAEASSAVSLSLILAIASWHWIEKPFRDKGMTRKAVLRVVATGAIFVSGLAGVIVLAQGFPQLMSKEAALVLESKSDFDPYRDDCVGAAAIGRRECTFGTIGATSKYVVVGDSHAAALRPAIEGVAALSGMRGGLWWRGACALLVGVQTYPRADSEDCTEFREAALEALKRDPSVRVVVLAGRWPSYLLGTNPEVGGSHRTYLVDLDGLVAPSPESTRELFARSITRVATELSESGKKVVILGTVPEPGFDVPTLHALALRNGSDSVLAVSQSAVEARNRHVDEILSSVASSVDAVTFIPMWPMFCDGVSCRVVEDGIAVYTDDDHISHSFAKRAISPKLDQVWSSVSSE